MGGKVIADKLEKTNSSAEQKEVVPFSFDLFTVTWFFVLFSAIGFLGEGLWSVLNYGNWADHYSLVWGPFTIIYGFAVIGLMALYKVLGRKNFAVQFLACFVAGSALEYVFSFLQELVFKSTSWDYSRLPLNLNGRICIKMSIIWGVVGLVFLRLVAPKLVKFTKYFRGSIMNFLGFALFVFMVINFSVSIMAASRFTDRHFGIEANSSLDKLLDDRFPDERMRSIYYNMVFVDERK